MVRAARRRAVFLDRDGVVNRPLIRRGKPYAPRRLEEFRLLPGVAMAIRRLRQAGFLVIVATNQPDIARRLVAPEVVAAMHRRLRRRLGIDEVRACPHRQSVDCACRKPKPGMLLAAAQAHRIDLQASVMVGDRTSDVLAGSAAGCYTIFLDKGYAETRRRRVDADAFARSLSGAAQDILSRLGRQ